MAESESVSDALLFDRALLLKGLASLDRVLGTHNAPHQDLILVGGSYLALTDLREATRDVDTVSRLGNLMRAAIDEVAQKLGFPPNWLNDHAATFIPRGLTDEHCSTVFEGKVLTVRIPSADWIFLMKLYAARAVDRPDMIRLWPHTGFESAAEAVERYWDAYPHAPEDEFLENFIAGIASSAS